MIEYVVSIAHKAASVYRDGGGRLCLGMPYDTIMFGHPVKKSLFCQTMNEDLTSLFIQPD
jgi:hypothetical protein